MIDVLSTPQPLCQDADRQALSAQVYHVSAWSYIAVVPTIAQPLLMLIERTEHPREGDEQPHQLPQRARHSISTLVRLPVNPINECTIRLHSFECETPVLSQCRSGLGLQ